jgi:hypothetical protein
MNYVRQKERMSIPVPVLICSDPSTLGRTRDLSLVGALIEGAPPLVVGEEVMLLLGHPGSGEAFPVAGRVARTDESGVGVEFTPRSPDGRRNLTEYVNEIFAGWAAPDYRRTLELDRGRLRLSV